MHTALANQKETMKKEKPTNTTLTWAPKNVRRKGRKGHHESVGLGKKEEWIPRPQ